MSATGAMNASMVASSASSIATSSARASSLRATGRYQAALAQTNAAMADEAARQTIEAGDLTASRKNLETRAKVGSLRAEQGASGVNVGSGSPALVRGGTELVGAIDEMTIRNNAARAAFGYKVKAIQERSDLTELADKSEANQAILSGGMEAISGPLSIYSNYLRWSKMMGGGSGGKVPDSYIPGEATG